MEFLSQTIGLRKSGATQGFLGYFAVFLGVAALLLLSGCRSRENTFFEPNRGIVEISCVPDSLNPGWNLIREKGGRWSGDGSESISEMEAGTYVLTWNQVPGWYLPGINPRTKNMLWGQTLQFVGEYKRNPPQDFQVTDPGWGTVWAIGLANSPIAWSGGYPEQPVKLELYLENDLVEVIAESTENDGEFLDFVVPETVTTDINYRIRVSQNDYHVFSPDFRIAEPLAVTSPTTGTQWHQGDGDLSVEWTGGASNYLDINLHSGAETWALAVNVPNDGHHKFDLPSIARPGDDYHICIEQSRNSGCSENFSIIDPVPLQITYPTADSLWLAGGGSEDIFWTGGMINGRVGIFLYQLDVMIDEIDLDTKNDGRHYYDPPDNIVSAENYTIHVVQGDSRGISPDFTIVDYPGLSVSRPHENTVWDQGFMVTIVWSGGDPDRQVAIHLYQNDELHTIVSSLTDNDRVFDYQVPATVADGENYKIVILQQSLVAYSQVFRVGPEFPITVIEPNAATVWTLGQNDATVSWEGGNPGFGYGIRLFRGETMVDTDLAYGSPGTNQTTFAVSLDLEPADDYVIRIEQQGYPFWGEPFSIGLPPAECEFSQESINFGAVQVGGENTQLLVVTNIGIAASDFEFSLTGAGDEFSLVGGAGVHILEAGAAHYLAVRYAPTGVGVDDCLLMTGSDCGDLAIQGEGISK